VFAFGYVKVVENGKWVTNLLDNDQGDWKPGQIKEGVCVHVGVCM
jgi:hypothetical protein